MTRFLAALACAVAVSHPGMAFAQAGGGAGKPHWYNAPAEDVPSIAIRAFLDIEREAFLADKTFDAVFQETSASFWGGGLQVLVWQGRVYGQFGASRLLKSNAQLVGQRVFVEGTNTYRLGIPLRATIQPFDIVGGYRFNLTHQLIPYVGAGFTHYHYTEESDFAEPSENLATSHGGFAFEGGAEWRLSRWVGIAGDAHYTHVPGILGSGGVSKVFSTTTVPGALPYRESDLGGWAARMKVVVGR